MKKITFITILLFVNFLANGQLNKKYQAVVKKFINCIKTNNINKLKTMVIYPLPRVYPLPPVKNKQDFVKRYNNIFDDSLKNIIIKSNIDNDWSDVGFRGIMLNNGLIWIDYDGNLMSITILSKTERKKRKKLIDEDRHNINKSLKNFIAPVIIMNTQKYKIRIDKISNNSYRLALWPFDSSMKNNPDIVIKNGDYRIEGSEHNEIYSFKKDNYEYECFINSYYEGSGKGSFVIYKNNDIIYNEDAKINGY